MQFVTLGRTGLKVSRLCLGMMTYGASKWRDWVLDEDPSRPFVQRALELGFNFFDTADSYGPHIAEELIAEALYPYPGLVIATKGGLERPGPDKWVENGRPEYLRQIVAKLNGPRVA